MSLQLRVHPRVGLACLAEDVYVFTAQLAFSLCGLLGFVQVVTLATWSPLAITLGCPVALTRPQTRQKLLLAPQPRIASLRPATSQLLDGLQ